MTRDVSALMTKTGFGGLRLVFHGSHDMGSLFCRACGVWGTDRRAWRPCPGLIR
jgi:hypothetical protein